MHDPTLECLVFAGSRSEAKVAQFGEIERQQGNGLRDVSQPDIADFRERVRHAAAIKAHLNQAIGQQATDRLAFKPDFAFSADNAPAQIP